MEAVDTANANNIAAQNKTLLALNNSNQIASGISSKMNVLLSQLNDSSLLPNPEYTTPTTLLPGKDTGTDIGYNKLPTAPTLSSLTNVSTVTISFEIPVPGGAPIAVSKSVDFSQPPYSGPISVFRGLLSALLTLTYFLMSFWAVRSAFAGL